MRHLLISWRGERLPRRRRHKRLAVRLDDHHHRKLERLARRSRVSESEVFAMLVESALTESVVPGPEPVRPVLESGPGPARVPAQQSAGAGEPLPSFDDLHSWAQAIIAAARATPHKFGERKAFIAGVIDELVARFRPVEPDAFRLQVRSMLPELNRRDLVRLVRADLVSAMDPGLVVRSELNHLNAAFHFVLLD